MKTQDVRSEIQELESLRKQAQFWRIGSVAALLLITVGSLTLMRNSVNGLLQPGPTQEEFSSQLSTKLQNNVVPQMQALASQTLVQMRPEIETQVSKLNTRVPEVSTAFMKEVETLQKGLPQKGEAMLQETLGKMLLGKEGSIKTMFPDATEAKIKTLTENVNNEAAERIMNGRDKLFSRPMQSLNNIVSSLQTIQDTEKVPAASQNADWEMVSSVVDLMHSDMQSLKPGSIQAMDHAGAGSKSTAQPAKMSNLKSSPAKSAPMKSAPVKSSQPKNSQEAGHVTKGY